MVRSTLSFGMYVMFYRILYQRIQVVDARHELKVSHGGTNVHGFAFEIIQRTFSLFVLVFVYFLTSQIRISGNMKNFLVYY
jgi:hypothetical protein